MINAVIKLKDKSVIFHSEQVETADLTLSEGFYESETDSKGNIHTKEKSLTELHKPYNSKETETILETVNRFFQKDIQEKVNKLGFVHKLGVLMHGIAGTGKTSLMSWIANDLIQNQKAIVFYCNNENTLGTAVGLAQKIRQIQDNPIIFIADEFERYAQSAESEMKNLLDGKDSVENSLFLASTNYIDKVPETLKERPSRFRLVVEVKGITDKNTMFEVTKEISDKVQPSLFTDQEIKDLYLDVSDITLDQIKHNCLDKITGTIVKKEEKKVIGFGSSKPKKTTLGWVKVGNSETESAKKAVNELL